MVRTQGTYNRLECGEGPTRRNLFSEGEKWREYSNDISNLLQFDVRSVNQVEGRVTRTGTCPVRRRRKLEFLYVPVPWLCFCKPVFLQVRLRSYTFGTGHTALLTSYVPILYSDRRPLDRGTEW